MKSLKLILLLIVFTACLSQERQAVHIYKDYVVVYKVKNYILISNNDTTVQLGNWTYYYKNYNLNDTIK